MKEISSVLTFIVCGIFIAIAGGVFLFFVVGGSKIAYDDAKDKALKKGKSNLNATFQGLIAILIVLIFFILAHIFS